MLPGGRRSLPKAGIGSITRIRLNFMVDGEQSKVHSWGCSIDFSQGFPCSSTPQFNQVGLGLLGQIGQRCQFWHDDGPRHGRMVLTESSDGENLVQMTIELSLRLSVLRWNGPMLIHYCKAWTKNSSLFLITFPRTYLH